MAPHGFDEQLGITLQRLQNRCPKVNADELQLRYSNDGCSAGVTVMRRSRSRVGGPVLLPHLIEHLLPELHHIYVM
jgi:hypothetical protein